jgi:hypothetical protein
MARLFTDSCGDHYDRAHVLLKWSGTNDINFGIPTISSAGRTGNCFQYRCGGGAQFTLGRVFPNAPELTVGLAHKIDYMPSSVRLGILQFTDGNTLQTWIGFDNVGRLIAYANGVDIAFSAPGIVTGNTWIYLEVQVSFAPDNTGSVTVHVNGHETINTHGVRTTGTANASANQFQIMSGNDLCGNSYFDDIYLNDGAVTAADPNNNGFLGDQQVFVRFPEAPGQLTQWSIGGTSPAATNWQSVSEAAPDDDATYVTTDTVGAIDLYKTASLPSSAQQVTAVQIVALSRSDGGSVSVEPVVGNGSTHVAGAPTYQNASYGMAFQTYGQNPLTGSDWLPSDFETLEIGLKRSS